MRAWELRGLNDEINTIEGHIAMTKLEIVRARDTIHSNNGTIEELESEAQSLRNQNTELFSDITISKQSLNEATAKLETLRAKLAEATGEAPEPPKPWQIDRPQTESTILSFCGRPE